MPGDFHPGAKGFAGSKPKYDDDYDRHNSKLILLTGYIGQLNRQVADLANQLLGFGGAASAPVGIAPAPDPAPAALNGPPTRELLTSTGVATFTLIATPTTWPNDPTEPALLVFYQGQLQDYTDQYTVAANVITFVDTPASGQKIKVVYWT